MARPVTDPARRRRGWTELLCPERFERRRRGPGPSPAHPRPRRRGHRQDSLRGTGRQRVVGGRARGRRRRSCGADHPILGRTVRHAVATFTVPVWNSQTFIAVCTGESHMAVDTTLIGTSTGRSRITIERGPVSNFAAAVTDEDPVYQSMGAAKAAGFD